MRKMNNKKKTRMKRTQMARPKESGLRAAYGPLVSSQSFQPRWMRCEMKYCEQFTAAVAAGTTADQIYRANSLFDPDRTGVGHQPRGFDQLTPMYNRYRVNRLRWHVEFAGAALSTNVCVALVNGAQTYTTIVDIGETNLRAPIKSCTTGGATTKFFGASDLWRVNGKSQLAYHTDDTTAAEFTNNPVETIDLHIVIQNFNIAAIAQNYTVTLIYDALFFDQILPGQS